MRTPDPKQRWLTFVHNHAKVIVACDFFVVITATFHTLYVLVLMEVGTRRLLRRECLDFLIPLNERHLRMIVKEWGIHYNRGRPHSSLGPGIPEPSPESVPASDHRHKLPAGYRVGKTPVLGGLHHEYHLVKEAAKRRCGARSEFLRATGFDSARKGVSIHIATFTNTLPSVYIDLR